MAVCVIATKRAFSSYLPICVNMGARRICGAPYHVTLSGAARH